MMDLGLKTIISTIGCSDVPMREADGACGRQLPAWIQLHCLVVPSNERRASNQSRDKDELYEFRLGSSRHDYDRMDIGRNGL